MHRDAEDLLHGGEDLGDFLDAPVGSVLQEDDGLIDICSDGTEKGLFVITGDTHTHTEQSKVLQIECMQPF